LVPQSGEKNTTDAIIYVQFDQKNKRSPYTLSLFSSSVHIASKPKWKRIHTNDDTLP